MTSISLSLSLSLHPLFPRPTFPLFFFVFGNVKQGGWKEVVEGEEEEEEGSKERCFHSKQTDWEEGGDEISNRSTIRTRAFRSFCTYAVFVRFRLMESVEPCTYTVEGGKYCGLVPFLNSVLWPYYYFTFFKRKKKEIVSSESLPNRKSLRTRKTTIIYFSGHPKEFRKLLYSIFPVCHTLIQEKNRLCSKTCGGKDLIGNNI